MRELARDSGAIVKERDFVLAVMSMFPYQKPTPVQVQKLFFLIDEKLPASRDCPEGVPSFEFRPEGFGPFDRKVFDVLNELYNEGSVKLLGDSWNPTRAYEVTAVGLENGKQFVDEIPETPRLYIETLGKWVFSVTIAQLISTIYQAFPEMKVNSVFPEW